MSSLSLIYAFRVKSLNSKQAIMRALCIFAVVIAVAVTGCHRKRYRPTNDLKISDPNSEKQLISGFYGLEQGQWRWTARRFAVVLLPPPGSQQAGATLRLKLYIPETQIQKLGPVTLRADVGEHSLAPEKFAKGGTLEYSQNIQPSLLGPNMLPVVFTFDKALPPAATDGRELGAVVSEVSLERRH
jgi:hypothetical protein